MRADAVGLERRRPLKALDTTRKLARIEFRAVEGELIGEPAQAAAAVREDPDAGSRLALASEMVGGAERLREDRRSTTPACGASSAAR